MRQAFQVFDGIAVSGWVLNMETHEVHYFHEISCQVVYSDDRSVFFHQQGDKNREKFSAHPKQCSHLRGR